MNAERLTQLAEHMEANAPLAVFDMLTYSTPVSSRDNNAWGLEAEQKLLGDCGTVCCLAGYTVLLNKQDLNQFVAIRKVSQIAMYFLGLTPNNPNYGHDLFSPTLAPEFCTPAQAAVAVRNVIAGKDPW